MKKYLLIGFGVVAVIVIVAAYFVGKNSSQSTGLTETTVSQPVVQEATTSPVGQAVQKTPGKTSSNPVVQSTATTNTITNSQPCLTIANDAAKNEEATNDGTQGITVLQAHYKNNNCYYEFSYPGEWSGSIANPEPLSKAVYTVINLAPNDKFIASCVFVNFQPKSCAEVNSIGVYSFINEAQFHLIEAQYLTN